MNEPDHCHTLVMGGLSFASVFLFGCIWSINEEKNKRAKACLNTVLYAAACAFGVMTVSYWMEKVVPGYAVTVRALEGKDI